MLDRLRRRTPDPPGFDPSRVPDAPRETAVETANGPFSCHAVTSPDGRWTLAYGRRADGGESRVFRLRDGDIDTHFQSAHPAAGAVANDGTVAVVERGESNTTTSRVRAFVDGTETLDLTLDATVTDVVASPSGELVAVATRRPDASVHAYDTRTGESTWTVTPRRATPRLLGIHGVDEPLVYVSRETRRDPYLAVDPSGEVAWGNERYQSTRPLTERVRSFVSRD
ncbi:hypothetical protein [Halorubrum sp. DTA46]|uniref:hypothetical protein n=1 Tax=Halorubrum sp. DTA46 TaxID=3402162 RepID=UPI003AAF161A